VIQHEDALTHWVVLIVALLGVIVVIGGIAFELVGVVVLMSHDCEPLGGTPIVMTMDVVLSAG
jgi:hypothetical protein